MITLVRKKLHVKFQDDSYSFGITETEIGKQTALKLTYGKEERILNYITTFVTKIVIY
jgi:hypothetical protein